MGENTMFYGIELILGAIGSLVGIGAGYLLLNSVFMGIDRLSKPRLMKQNENSLDT
jgi:ABC-type antimicrobial peptide transport system permease subunit